MLPRIHFLVYHNFISQMNGIDLGDISLSLFLSLSIHSFMQICTKIDDKRIKNKINWDDLHLKCVEQIEESKTDKLSDNRAVLK